MLKPLGYWPKTLAKLRPKRRNRRLKRHKPRSSQLESLEARQMLAVDTVELAPMFDGYVLGGPDSSNPPVEDLYLGASPNETFDQYESVLAFDLTTISGGTNTEQVTYAELRLGPVFDPEVGSEIAVSLVEGNDLETWAESVSWDIKPDDVSLEATLLDTSDVVSSEVVRLDITDAVSRIVNRGDMDWDGSLDVALDTAAFELAIKDPDAYRAQYGYDSQGMLNRADANRDDSLTTSDLEGFLAWHGYLLGDINFDGVVDWGGDGASALNNFSETGPLSYQQGDVNLDGLVDGDDLNTMLAFLGAPAPALVDPELALWLYSPDTSSATFGFALASSRNSAPAVQVPELFISYNDQPILAPQDHWQYLGQDVEEAANLGVLVADLVTGMSDVDEEALQGIAIISAQETDGQIEYQLDSGSPWIALTSLPEVSETSALVLPANGEARVRFVPDSGFAGTEVSSILFRAWDQSDDSLPGELVDASDLGVSSAFSEATDSLSFALTPAIGPEISSSFETDIQESPQVAISETGDYVVIWKGEGPLGAGVYGKMYEADGTLKTPYGYSNPGPFRIGGATTSAPSLDMASDGSFVVAWSGEDNLSFRRYSEIGQPLATSIQTGIEWGDSPSTHVAVSDEGTIAVTWVALADSEELDIEKLYIRGYNSSGAPLTSSASEVHGLVDHHYAYPSGTAIHDTGGSIAVLDSGQFIVTYARHGRIFVEGYDPEGSWANGGQSNPLIGDPDFGTNWIYIPEQNYESYNFIPEYNLDSYASAPVVAADVDGGFLLAWQEEDAYEGNIVVKAQSFGFSSSEFAIGDPMTASDPSTAYATAPTLAASEDGSFGVAWQTNNVTLNNPGVTLAWYDGEKELLVSQERPASGTIPTGGWGEPAIASSAGGEMLVAWTGARLADGADLGDDGDVFAQRYRLPQLPTPTSAFNFSNHLLREYGSSGDGTWTLEEGGHEIQLTGDGRYAIYFPYMVTPNTILSFEFESSEEGLAHGIGLDSDLVDDSQAGGQIRFDLFGSIPVGVTDFQYPGTTNFDIPLGQYFTGKSNYLTFTNSDIIASDVESIFRNLRFHEKDPIEGAIDLSQGPFHYNVDIEDFDFYSQNTTIHFEESSDFITRIDYDFTPDTVMDFYFSAPSEGSSSTIKFGNTAGRGGRLSYLNRFQIHGTDTSSSVTNYDFDGLYDGNSPAAVHYEEIPVGSYFEVLQ